MKEAVEVHPNPFIRKSVVNMAETRISIVGYQLEPGDVLEADDVYASASGQWERCPCPGATLLEGSDVVWVRPRNVAHRVGVVV